MNIGELFINLGIKGTEKTVGALSNVKKGLGDLTSMSIEAKAGILGALYGLERLTAISGAMGTSLTNLTALTGASAKELQQWDFAARQGGISAGEMEGSIKAVQMSMTNMLQGKGIPEGFGQVAAKVGLDPSRLRDWKYVLGQLQKFSQEVPADLARSVIGSFGVSEGTISLMRRNMFRPDVFARAPVYGDKEVAALDRANIAWSNLSNKIQMAVGHLNAMHGGKLVKDISMITDKIIILASHLIDLADKLKVFQWIGKAFEGWGKILEGDIKIVDALSGNKKAQGDISSFFGAVPGALKLMGSDLLDRVLPPHRNNPNVGGQQNNVNQNFYFQHDGKNAQDVGKQTNKAVKDAFRQIPAGATGGW